MTAPSAREAAPWVELLARVGYAAKAMLYLVVGSLAGAAVMGRSARAVDTQGALRTVHRMDFGRLVLLVMAAGLLGYALWRLVEGIFDPEHRGSNPKALAVRAGLVVRGLIHGGLALTALRLATRDRPLPHADQIRRWTTRVLELPGGELLVWLAALGIAGYGLYQFYRAYAAKLSHQLDLSELSTRSTRWVVGVSRFGLAARGVVFCLIGYLLARAAQHHDPAQAGGVRKSLRMIALMGQWPLASIGLGLIAYGVYELLNARYRRIRVG
jgi:hypothetical protein